MNRWIECKTKNCLQRNDCQYTTGALWCDKKSCMKNINGKCVHRKCTMENPDYRAPEDVAKDVEVQMIAAYKLEQERKRKRNKKSNK